MNKLTYEKIKTKEELKKRIENGILSVGCHLSKIEHLLSETKNDTNKEKIIVIYSSKYGTTKKEFFI